MSHHGHQKMSRGHPNLSHGHPKLSHGQPKMSHGHPKMSHGHPSEMSHDHSRLSQDDHSKFEVDSKGRRRSRIRATSGGAKVKVRTKLPPIEAYEKEVDFRLEGLGRIIVRLERLMGSDRVRLTDAKFMQSFLQKLEEEEKKAWDKRTKARKKAERLRSRDLVIHGHMEPGIENEDLKQHPVFRVNRVLKELATFDQNMTLGQIQHLPPIIETEPFEFDGSGAIFKTYPYHVELKNAVPPEELEAEPSPINVKNSGTNEDFARPSTGSSADSKPRSYQFDYDQEDEDYDEDEVYSDTTPTTIHPNDRDEEWTGEWGDGEEGLETRKKSPSFNPLTEAISLTALQQSYGIPPHEDLAKWAPFRSDLVDLVYMDDHDGILQMYHTAEEVINVYERENLTVDEFVVQLSRLMRDNIGGGGGAAVST